MHALHVSVGVCLLVDEWEDGMLKAEEQRKYKESQDRK